MNLVDQLRLNAEQRGQQDALVTDQGPTSYRQLLGQVEDEMARLKSAGLGPGKVVGLTIADEARHLVTALALLCLETHHVTLATFDTDETHADLEARCGVEAVVDLKGIILVAQSDIPAPAGGGLYLRTSGTTGRPSIVGVSLDQLVAQARANRGYDTHRLLCLASVEHNNAKRHRLYTLLSGGTNVFRAPRDTRLVEFCQRFDVTCLDIAPIHAAGLVATLEGRPLDSVMVRVSGTLVPPALRAGLAARVTRQVSVRYGATECGTIAVTGDDACSGKTVGHPVAGASIEIVDPEGHPLQPGETGEIRVRTSGAANAYHGDPELTALRFRDGWFQTGDVGTLGDDGALVVEGRRDDMMILNGINIFPAEIEETLERHGAVRSAAAAAIRSGTHGDIPVAVVELHDGNGATGAELLDFARQHLALRAPRRIVVVPEIPRNAQGKVLRQGVLDIVVPGRQKT